jgi:mRNA interferase RelE/StbE
MEVYKVYWKKSAKKDLLNIDKKIILKIFNIVESLKVNPYPQNTRKLHGTNKIFRTRVGSYRIIYIVDIEQKNIIIYYIRHRKEVYRRIR